MTGRMRGRRRYAGARLRVGAGRARLLPAAAPEPDMVAGRFSVISPGTERRHLAGEDREAGYMTLGRTGDAAGWVLAPVPHGAAFDAACPGAVTAPPQVPPRLVALARFQQMACLGLDRLPATDLSTVTVVGSGPVALGCVLELRRRGATGIQVVTSRRYPPIGRAPGVTCVSPGAAEPTQLVIDAAGLPRRAADLTAPGGVLGLLGTPDEEAALPALPVHRGGWTVQGMHELAPTAPDTYQKAFTQAVTWLTDHLEPALATAWCRTVPGARAPELFALLESPGRPAEPVLLLDWRDT
ncbi:hypothetical protein ACGRHY_27645 [Streptomyces sp. HK10]|uniref:hypothetical protein n=1 Tax=Streptomyces sp. HK10 TaxID=3373255 RepID=UPI00374A4C6A